MKIIDEKIFLKDYGDDLRQIAITCHGKIKPALLTAMDDFQNLPVAMLENRRLVFTCDTSS